MQQNNFFSRPKITFKDSHGITQGVLVGENIIGKGAFGHIWSLAIANTDLINTTFTLEASLSENMWPRQPILLKHIHSSPEMFNQTQKHVLKEADFLRRVNPDWAKDVIFLSTEPLFLALVMPWQHGENLDTICKSRRLTFSGFFTLCTMLINAITRMHKVNVIHLDLIPANIMLENLDPPQGLRIIDFGLAQEPDTLIKCIIENSCGPTYPQLSSDRIIERILSTEPVDTKVPAQFRHDYYSAIVIMQFLLLSIITPDTEKNSIFSTLSDSLIYYDQTINNNASRFSNLHWFFESQRQQREPTTEDDMFFPMDP